MTLNDIFHIEGLYSTFSSDVGLVRHTATELGDYLLDQATYDFYQSVQEDGKFDRIKYLLSFLVNKEGKTIFRGVYEKVGKESLESKHFGNIFLPSESRDHYNLLCGKYCFYHLTKTGMLSTYDMRIVIDWGKSKIAWFQYHDAANPKVVDEILPRGFFSHFEDHLSVSLTRSELEFLFANKMGNPVWQSQLSKVGGIYLIQDEADGQQYVGSATGKDGIWGRWETYFRDPTGGNKLLQVKIALNGEAFRTFRYSILEVFPGDTLKHEVIQKESLYKRKLGTRAFGLNEN